MNCDVFFRSVGVRWEMMVTRGCGSWFGVWEVLLEAQIKMEVGLSGWLGFIPSLYLLQKRSTLSTNFHLRSQISCLFFTTRGDKKGGGSSLRNTSALSKVIRAKLVGGLIKVFAVTVGEGEKSFLSVFSWTSKCYLNAVASCRALHLPFLSVSPPPLSLPPHPHSPGSDHGKMQHCENEFLHKQTN